MTQVKNPLTPLAREKLYEVANTFLQERHSYIKGLQPGEAVEDENEAFRWGKKLSDWLNTFSTEDVIELKDAKEKMHQLMEFIESRPNKGTKAEDQLAYLICDYHDDELAYFVSDYHIGEILQRLEAQQVAPPLPSLAPHTVVTHDNGAKLEVA